MDACVGLYDHVQSVSFALVIEKKWVIRKKSFGGYNSIEEGSEFKATIAWDLPCCPIYLNII